MEFKGTKGKWNQNLFTHSRLVFVNQGATICEMMPTNFKYCEKDEIDSLQKEIEYNALLISKAPEMLELLQRIEKILTYETIEPNSPIQLEIFELISEATEL